MRTLFVVLLLAVVCIAKNPTKDPKKQVGPPTSCAIWHWGRVEEDMMGGKPVQPEDDDEEESKSSNYFYDPGQFIANGGFYSTKSGATYYFSLCKEAKEPITALHCSSKATAVCYQNLTGTTSLITTEERSSEIRPDYTSGVIVKYSKAAHFGSKCSNGTTYSFVLNCSKNFNPETNYTVSYVSEGECQTVFYINTPAGCPITMKRERNESSSSGHNHSYFKGRNFLVAMGVVAAVVFCCSCLVLCCACRRNCRQKCANKNSNGSSWCSRKGRSWCAKKQQAKPVVAPQQQPPKPIAQQQPIQPRQPVQMPQPPVTPPPRHPMQPMQPQYFVPAPQMNPMYPNLFTGGYVPLVPMPQQPIQHQQPVVHQPIQPQQPVQQPQQQNPFLVPISNTVVRENQINEDERLARALQAQFNNEA